MGGIVELIKQVDEIVWGPWLLCLLLGTGCYLHIRLKFLPLRKLKYALVCAVGLENREKNKVHSTGVSSFESLTTELAATIGTGNIVGVATALVLGGPGALFWMLISAIVGMSLKLVESMLSVKYRQRNSLGEYVGGPMYTMEYGLPGKKFGKILAHLFAVFAVMASFGMGNMTQSNSIAAALDECFRVPPAKTGLVVAILTILIVLGGIKSIAKCTQFLVPAMGILYLAGCFAVIGKHIENVPESVAQIVLMAMNPAALGGGVVGGIMVSARDALRFGVSRGVFSNEAGLGAAGISAAAADTEDYVKQGYISMTGVFLDTIVICSVTGLALLSSGVVGQREAGGELLTGTALTIAAFRTALGDYGAVFVSVSIALFAFATIAGWAYQGERAFEYLVGNVRWRTLYRFVYGGVTFIGAVCSLEVVWNFSDICNGLMAVPNLICVLMLSGQACRELHS